jgi:hypothetical protein
MSTEWRAVFHKPVIFQSYFFPSCQLTQLFLAFQLSFFLCIFSSFHSYFTPLHGQENKLYANNTSVLHTHKTGLFHSGSQWFLLAFISLPTPPPFFPTVTTLSCAFKVNYTFLQFWESFGGAQSISKKISQLARPCRWQNDWHGGLSSEDTV